MKWKPLTRQALDEIIVNCLEVMDDAVKVAWQAIRIEPEKWQCIPWGDEGGGFWVVAEKDGQVVWYNDIEGGFNISPFARRGTIREYAYGQTTFEEFLLGLPAAREAEPRHRPSSDYILGASLDGWILLAAPFQVEG